MSTSMNRVSTSLIATAYHEAGHALADFRLGFKIKKVTIVPSGGATGVVYSLLGIKPKRLDYGNPTSKTVARCHDKVVTLLAGEAAQRRFNSRSVRSWMLKGDRGSIIEILTRLHRCDEELRAVYRYLKIRARNLVAHRHNWPMIEDLVKVLLERRTMNGSEVESEFRSSLSKLAKSRRAE